jgi:DNA-binding transcriptional ArsR family regulator
MRTTDTDTEQRPAVVSLQEAHDIINALSSDIGRQILNVLHDDAMPPSAIADAIDTSIQNVSYHLERLQAADLVSVTDTWYSSRGREMDVYALTADPITLCVGERGTPSEVPLDDRRQSERERRQPSGAD